MIKYTLPLILLFLTSTVQAEDYTNPDQYYRAVTMRELDYRLAPAMPESQRNTSGKGMNRFKGGCPDQINIGGIGENTRVIGSVDINVTIDKDFIVDCNRF